MKKFRGSLFGIVITAILCLGISGTASASVYKNKEFTLKQPDNTEVKVKITGDEYYQHIESMDGYTLCRNEEGWICYAKTNDNNSEYIATDKVYKGEKYEAPSVIKNNIMPSSLWAIMFLAALVVFKLVCLLPSIIKNGPNSNASLIPIWIASSPVA